MSGPISFFRYSGNKTRLLQFYRKKGQEEYKRIVELYLGFGSYFMNQQNPGLGYEINKDLYGIWKYLQNTSIKRLQELQEIVKQEVKNHLNYKPDVRNIKDISEQEMQYIRLNCCSVYVGQFSSWTIYPQHVLPVPTEEQLRKSKNIEIINDSCEKYQEQDGDLIFIDPPYKNTFANYRESNKIGIEKEYKPEQTINIISKISSPIIFTYGTDAPDVFPMYEWNTVATKKVPNIRKGGCKIRKEYVSYINWK